MAIPATLRSRCPSARSTLPTRPEATRTVWCGCQGTSPVLPVTAPGGVALITQVRGDTEVLAGLYDRGDPVAESTRVSVCATSTRVAVIRLPLGKPALLLLITRAVNVAFTGM